MRQRAWAIVNSSNTIVLTGEGVLAIYLSHGYAEHNCLYSEGERVNEVLLEYKEEIYAAQDIGC